MCRLNAHWRLWYLPGSPSPSPPADATAAAKLADALRPAAGVRVGADADHAPFPARRRACPRRRSSGPKCLSTPTSFGTSAPPPRPSPCREGWRWFREVVGRVSGTWRAAWRRRGAVRLCGRVRRRVGRGRARPRVRRPSRGRSGSGFCLAPRRVRHPRRC